ncbi:MAG: GLUG motif-containing protein, partial [Rikenellaceae bacterium]
NDSGSVTNCYNTAAVSGDNFVGGVVGNNVSGSVMNCYNTAAVSGEYFVGGVVGYNDSGSVMNCYNTAAVSGEDYVGGVVGYNDSGSVTSCYWLDVTGDNASAGVGSGTDTTTPLLAAEMQSEVLLNALNNGAYTYNQSKAEGAVEAYAWRAVTGGMPKLDPSGTVDSISYDMEYVGGTYMIRTAVGLYAFADLVNGELNGLAFVDWGENNAISAFSTKRQTAISGTLTADIDLGGCEEKQWTPIANSSSGSDYHTGTFDGGNHLVSGLYINGTTETSTSSYKALFGCLGGLGNVKNVGVSGSVSGHDDVAGVVADSYGTVTNCYNTATITGTSTSIGGIVGNNRSRDVMNCYNTGAITGYSSVGGITGNCEDANCNVVKCYNSAAVTATSNNEPKVGGIVGNNYYNCDITNCYYNSSFGTTYTNTDGTAMTIVEMMSQDFVDTLNTYVTDNSGNGYFSWAQVSNSFPIFSVTD